MPRRNKVQSKPQQPKRQAKLVPSLGSVLSEQIAKALSKSGPIKTEPELLLGPQIPKPLHSVNPRTILGPLWWNQTRQAAYKANNYCCTACGVRRYEAKPRSVLEAHEVYRIDYVKGRMTYVRTVALCPLCHMVIHLGRLEMLLREGHITQQLFVDVVQHRDRVLAEAGLTLPPTYNGECAPWSTWRLVLNRRLYKPIYKDQEAWQRAMAAKGTNR